MAKKINLEMTSVENREMRLGTIIAWDGAASDLVKESDYEGRKEKKKGNDIPKGKQGGCCGKLCAYRAQKVRQSVYAHRAGDLGAQGSAA